MTKVTRILALVLLLVPWPAAAAKDPACVQQCDLDYQACLSQCHPETEECLGYCDNEYNGCVSGCPNQCTGPTVREYTTQVVSNRTYLGLTRCLTSPFSGRRLWDYWRTTYKITKYRETTQCNGTKTTEVVSVTYSTVDCWANSNLSCSSSVGSTTNYLICFGSAP